MSCTLSCTETQHPHPPKPQVTRGARDAPHPLEVRGREALPSKISTTSQKPVQPPMLQDLPPQDTPKSQITPQVRLKLGKNNKNCCTFEDCFNTRESEGAQPNHPGRAATLQEKVDATLDESNEGCASFKRSFRTEYIPTNAKPLGEHARDGNVPPQTGA